MTVYIGPCNYGTPEENGERYITADSSNEPPKVIPVVGDLDMKKQRIINLQDPREDEPNDATTVGYVGRVAEYVFNKKVNWSGGTMTGELNMGGHKLTQVANPEDDQDVVNKQFLNNILQLIRPYDLGRFLVFPDADKSKSYFAVGSKRNIDLSGGKVFEIFNDSVNDPQNIMPGNLNRTLMPLRGKDAVLMHLNSEHTIAPNLPKPWTFLFSIKPFDSPLPTNNITLNFGTESITISWSENSFTYTIGSQNPIAIEINTSKLNHFAFEYSGKRLIAWVNGASRKTHTNLTLNNLTNINIGVNFLGVASIYNRELSNQEIAEHFIQFHVKPFTDNEVKG